MAAETLVPPGEPDRLDRVLARVVPELSRGAARRLIAAGCVFVNGRRCRVASRMLQPGDRLRVANAPAPAAVARLLVLYEDPSLIAVDKPAGMPAVPTRTASAGSAQDMLEKQADARGKRVRLWPVHRLDADTSGVLLFAKCAAAAEALSRAFRERAVEKRYLAVVAGVPPEERGTIDAPIAAAGRRAGVAAHGKDAVTEWVVLRRAGGGTLVALHPHTGRMHQLRVHLAHAALPIVGDRLYGGPPAPRLMLHAATLRVPHPVDHRPVDVWAPIPPEFSTSA